MYEITWSQKQGSVPRSFQRTILKVPWGSQIVNKAYSFKTPKSAYLNIAMYWKKIEILLYIRNNTRFRSEIYR